MQAEKSWEKCRESGKCIRFYCQREREGQWVRWLLSRTLLARVHAVPFVRSILSALSFGFKYALYSHWVFSCVYLSRVS